VIALAEIQYGFLEIGKAPRASGVFLKKKPYFASFEKSIRRPIDPVQKDKNRVPPIFRVLCGRYGKARCQFFGPDQ
jgi:hypothetical protein